MAKDNQVSSVDARERARQMAAKQSKVTKKSNSGWIKATVALLIVAIIAIVAIVMINTRNNTIEDAGPVPSSANQYGGIVITKDGIVKDASAEPSRDANSLQSATASHEPTAGASKEPLPLGVVDSKEAKTNKKPVQLVVFQDYNCIHCAEFEQEYGDTIQKLVDEGKVTLEIRNLTFLDSEYPTDYSARAANAAYSVANQVSTDDFLNWQKEMFTHQGTPQKNDAIIDIASSHGADIKKDMDENTWRPLVKVVTPESSQNGIHSTPSVFADGQLYTSKDFTAWVNGIISAKEKS